MRDRMRRLLACLCLAACCPCCFPCYICALRSRKRRRIQEEFEAHLEDHRLGPRSPENVHPLRRGRRRRVSIPQGVVYLGDEKKGTDIEEKSLEQDIRSENEDIAQELAAVEGVIHDKPIATERSTTALTAMVPDWQGPSNTTQDKAITLTNPIEARTKVFGDAQKSAALSAPTNEAQRLTQSKNTLQSHPSMITEPQTTHPQNQSILFAKLPPELRSLIWRQCVASYNLYLGIPECSRRIRHCKVFESRGLMAKNANTSQQDRLMSDNHFMGVLLSCRRIYSEAISYVYSGNTFLFAKPSTVLALAATTLEKRFSAISTIVLRWKPQLQHGISFGPSEADVLTWKRTTDLLASIKGLKILEICFWDASIYGSPGQWPCLVELLQGFKKVRQDSLKKGKWQLRLEQTSEVDGLQEMLGETPYQIRYGLPEGLMGLFWLM